MWASARDWRTDPRRLRFCYAPAAALEHIPELPRPNESAESPPAGASARGGPRAPARHAGGTRPHAHARVQFRATSQASEL